MKKNIKIYLTLLLTIFCLFTSISYPINALSDVYITQDSDRLDTLPKNFRKTTDISKVSELGSLNTNGLDNLNISGSGQFTPPNLPLMLENIDTNLPIIDIDLRQESHGFVNDIAISFSNSNNSANSGLTLNEVIKKENEDLSSIKLNTPLTLHNKNKTILPKKVEDEATLTKSNNISYIRIPVTDGGLPPEDMVNYFIDIVKNNPRNTWFHFHCKAGIGRTTTFMIMYDILKNGNNVSLHDIIARQLLLAGLSQKDSVDFYVGRRYNFLSDFYSKHSKNNSISSKTSLINPLNLENSNLLKCTCSSYKENTDSYIKNNITPKFLYVISDINMTKAEQTTIVTLQGLISSKSEKQIYIISPSEPDYEIWLKDLKENYNVKYKIIKEPWTLIDKFKSYINGYVLYSTVKAPSINNACTLASLNDSIAIDESIEDTLNNHGVTNLIKDCRDTDKYWAFNTLWNSGLNHSTVIELPSDKYMSLRDYAILSKSLVFYENEVENTDLRNRIFSSIDDGGRILGWGPDEHTNVSIASKFGIDMIAADWSYNLSVLSSYPSTPKTQILMKIF